MVSEIGIYVREKSTTLGVGKRRWKEALGYTDAEIGCMQEELEKRIHSNDRERVLGSILELLKGAGPAPSGRR